MSKSSSFHYVFFCLIQVMSLQKLSSIQRFKIIILVLGEDPSYGYYATGPMFDVAFREAAVWYPNLSPRISKHVLYQKNVKDCAAAGADMLDVAGKLFDLIDRRDELAVLLAPGCSLEMMSLADFAREMNVVLIGSTSADTFAMNKQRYSTFISFGPSGRSAQVPALKIFMEMYSLTTVTVFCETLSNYLNLAAYFGEIDSVRKPEYEVLLLKAKHLSRVIILETREDIVRKIMVTAHGLNMTDGSFVFLFLQANLFARHVDISDITNDQPYNVINEQLFKPLIFVRFDYSYQSQSTEIFNSASEIPEPSITTASEKTTSECPQKNEMGYSAYEAASALLQALRESKSGEDNIPLSTDILRRTMVNRTYFLKTQNVSIEPAAYRLRDVLFCRYNATLKTFQPSWKYDAFLGKIASLPVSFSHDWYGQSFPPPNRPKCGFVSENCDDNDTGSRWLATIFGSSAALCISAVMGVVYRWKTRPSNLGIDWWKLETGTPQFNISL